MSARTQVGIVEWGRRAAASEASSRAAADALGRAALTATDPVARLALLDQARRQGWCADQWASVVPVLHDVDLAGGPATEAEATQATVDRWRAWSAETAAVADAPYRAVLDRVLRELEGGTAT